MGTMLIAAGLPIDRIPAAAWHHSRLVGSIHRQYVDAGADIVTTCTFTLPSLAPARRDAIRAAVDAARDAGAPLIAASIGPAQTASRADILHYYAHVVETFLDCGMPDCFLAEAVMAASHARVIHEIIRSNCRDLPLIVSAAVNSAGTMLSGEAVSDLYAMFSTDPAVIPGLNCFTLPAPLTTLLRQDSSHHRPDSPATSCRHARGPTHCYAPPPPRPASSADAAAPLPPTSPPCATASSLTDTPLPDAYFCHGKKNTVKKSRQIVDF